MIELVIGKMSHSFTIKRSVKLLNSLCCLHLKVRSLKYSPIDPKKIIFFDTKLICINFKIELPLSCCVKGVYIISTQLVENDI